MNNEQTNIKEIGFQKLIDLFLFLSISGEKVYVEGDRQRENKNRERKKG